MRVSAVRADGIDSPAANSSAPNSPSGRPGERAGLLADLDGLEVNRANQLVTDATLRTTRDPDIFAIGDCAAVPGRDPIPVPPRAQAAFQEASRLVRQLKRRLQGLPLEPFVYRDFGSLVSFGRMGAVATS